VVFEPSIRYPPVASAVDASVRVVHIEEGLARRVGGADGIEEGGKLGVGDGQAVDLKGREGYAVGRPLVRRAGVAPHRKLAGRDMDHLRRRERGAQQQKDA
jgi:hypothetical protein